MKLPKGMGNLGSLMKQAQEAMERAKHLEEELRMLEIESVRTGVTVKFNGAGDLLSIKIDSELVDKDDIETLEDAVLLAIREGQAKSADVRQQKMQEITGNLPLPPGMGM